MMNSSPSYFRSGRHCISCVEPACSLFASACRACLSNPGHRSAESHVEFLARAAETMIVRFDEDVLLGVTGSREQKPPDFLRTRRVRGTLNHHQRQRRDASHHALGAKTVAGIGGSSEVNMIASDAADELVLRWK